MRKRRDEVSEIGNGCGVDGEDALEEKCFEIRILESNSRICSSCNDRITALKKNWHIY